MTKCTNVASVGVRITYSSVRVKSDPNKTRIISLHEWIEQYECNLK